MMSSFTKEAAQPWAWIYSARSANTPKPLADPEMNVTRVQDLFPHLLHGKSVIQIYHWPSQPAAEFQSNTQHSWAHSWEKPLSEVDELLRVALDARRLRNEIASFADVPAQVAILYSQTSTSLYPARDADLEDHTLSGRT